MLVLRPCLLALAVLALAAPPALAHAILLESAPAEGASIPAGHADIRLRFNSRIDAARSRVALTQSAAAVLTLRESDRPDVLTAATDLTPGAAVLRWQVLAVDGHITRGVVHFTVVPAEH